MNGEITIVLGGQPRKLHFTMWAVEKQQEILALDENKGKKGTVFNTTALIYAGLANQYRMDKKELDFNIADVTRWVYEWFDSDAGGAEQMHIVSEAFTNCNAFKNLIKAANNEDKKKSNGRMSELSLSANSD